MANIRNTLTIIDNASAVLKRVDKYAQQVLKTFENLEKSARQPNSMGKMMQDVDKYARSASASLQLISPAILAGTGAVTAMIPMLTAAAAIAEQLAAAVNIASFGAAATVGGVSNAANDLDGAVNSNGGGFLDGILGNLNPMEWLKKLNPIEMLKSAWELMKNIAQTAWEWAEAMTEGAQKIIEGLREAVNLAQDMWEKIQDISEKTDFVTASTARIGILAPGTDTAAWDALYQTANATYSSIENTANIVNRSLTTGLFAGEDAFRGSLKFAELLNKSMVATGTNAQQAASAIEQLMQGLGAGQLYWQDLRIILQQAPGVAMILAEGLNKLNPELEITAQNLRQMSADGELTAQTIVEAFAVMEDEINEMFGNMPRLFSQMETVFENMFTQILGYLGNTGGAMDLLIQKMEQFNEWLTATAEGAQALAMIGTIIEGFVLLVDWLLDRAAELYQFLIENSWILIGVLSALAIAALVAGIQMVISFAMAHWQLLLLIIIVSLMVRHMAQAGMDIWEIIQSVLTSFLTAVFTIWNAAVSLGQIIINVIVAVHNFFVNVIYGAQIRWLDFQIFIQKVILGIMNITLLMLEGIFGMISAVLQGIEGMITAIWGSLASFITWVLERVRDVANAINSMGGFLGVNIDTSGIDSAIANVNNMDPSGMFNGITDAFDSILESQKNKIQEQMDKIADMEAQQDALNTERESNLWDFVDLAWMKVDDPAGLAAELAETITSTIRSLYDKFVELGEGDDTSMEEFWKSFDMNDLLEKIGNPSGGKLDEVGKISSDVSIADEDLKLLRDIAARNFLLNLSQVTPQLQVSFGDVRETADVNKIMDAVADMMEEALATSLVYD